jgi:hypothetical protein
VVLKPQFIAYTQRIAKRHDLPTKPHVVWAGAYDIGNDRWEAPEVYLPTNPFTDRPVLLAPRRFLRQLPTMSFESWVSSLDDNAALRDDLSADVLREAPRDRLIAIARTNPAYVRNWARHMEDSDATPYEVERDPELLWRWSPVARGYAQDHPITLQQATNTDEFFDVIERIIEGYRHFVENAGWRLLWDKGSPAAESKAQLLFQGLALSHCEANDISVEAEVNLGRGPVDFKFTRGYRRRALVEVKKLHASKFWAGLEKQLPTYLKADKVKDGWYLVIQFAATKTSRREEGKRLLALDRRVASAATRWGLRLRHVIVDARKKASASKL